MAWQNWSMLEHNLIELPINCTSTYYLKPLLGFLLTNVRYMIPFYIMGFNGLLQNFLVIQTLVVANFREKWGTVYRLAYSMNGLVISICLMISVFWNHGLFFIIGFTCLILNSISLWISAVLAFERMLMQIFFFKLYGMTCQHAIIISVLVYLCVTVSYILSLLFSQISFIIFFFHLIGPGVIHTISFVITCASIIQRKCYLSDNTFNFASLMKICSDFRGYIVAPLCFIICLTVSIISIRLCLLVLFNVVFFLPHMFTFMIYILPSEENVKKFKTQSICGQLLIKLNFY
jgi:hypothetical protein